MKIILLIAKLCFIVAGFWSINYFVENVLAPDYTANWQVYPNWDAVIAAQKTQKEDATIVPQDTKDVYLSGIMRERQTDRSVLFLSFAILIAGYYCTKVASNEIKRRGVIILADGTKNLDAATIISNRRIVLMKFVSIALFMLAIFFVVLIVIGSPMTRSDATGKLLCVNTNPYCNDDSIIIFFFLMIMPVLLLLAPYFVFKKITNILTLKYCLKLFAAVILIIIICFLLHIPQYYAPVIANSVSGLGIFASFNGKMDRVAKTLGM